MRIILGSKSEGRKKILESMGYKFEIMDPNIDEKVIRERSPQALTLKIALAKSEALLPKITGEEVLLITADQVVVYRGEVREKPIDRAEAIKFLTGYNYYPAQTVTSVVVTYTPTGLKVMAIDSAMIYFNEMPKEVIERYVETGDAYNHAGAFWDEHELLAPYVRAIDGEEESIVGLPKAMILMLMDNILNEIEK